MYLPSFFISHGSPDIALMTEHPTYRFLQELPKTFSQPDAIVIFSAHWCTEHVMVSMADRHKAIYDFGGFDPRLYAMTYEPKGQPELAREVHTLLEKVDGKAELVNTSGLDHGVWILLKLMYPKADIPVVQVSIQPDRPLGYHYNLGSALAELRKKNILIIGSGAMTHNLYELSRYEHDAAPPGWVSVFANWMKERLEAGEKDTVLQYRKLSPHALENHPTEEHLQPLFIAMGAGDGGIAKRIHTASTYGTIMMDAYKFTGIAAG
ncbi:MAG: class III extradiol ring-cleavage dioxygenase [Desulfocapsaceae bacterium]|nr:class III extradiol ring-cleavage dioxygenase [Desulfocapsaceae bacterium]